MKNGKEFQKEKYKLWIDLEEEKHERNRLINLGNFAKVL